MSTTYNVRTGDTLEIVSKRVYGTEADASTIQSANPGIVEPLTPGTVLNIPERIANIPRPVATRNVDEAAIYIDGQRLTGWTQLSITQSADAPSTCLFQAPFTAENAAQRKLFRPLEFKTVEVVIGAETAFTGTMLPPTPSGPGDSKTVDVSCYSRCAVLNDCTPGIPDDNLEFTDQTLGAIAASLSAPFGIGVIDRREFAPVIKKVAINSTEFVWSFLSKLAAQENAILTDDVNGNLVIDEGVYFGQPVETFEQGLPPMRNMTPSYQGQRYFSHVTGLATSGVDTAADKYTIQNTRLKTFRPHCFTVSDVEDGKLKKAVASKIGRMVGDVVTYSMFLTTWRTKAGVLLKPNTLVRVKAPSAMVYDYYTFAIRSVNFNKTAKDQTSTVVLNLPGALAGALIGVFPWDE